MIVTESESLVSRPSPASEVSRLPPGSEVSMPPQEAISIPPVKEANCNPPLVSYLPPPVSTHSQADSSRYYMDALQKYHQTSSPVVSTSDAHDYDYEAKACITAEHHQENMLRCVKNPMIMTEK